MSFSPLKRNRYYGSDQNNEWDAVHARINWLLEHVGNGSEATKERITIVSGASGGNTAQVTPRAFLVNSATRSFKTGEIIGRSSGIHALACAASTAFVRATYVVVVGGGPGQPLGIAVADLVRVFVETGKLTIPGDAAYLSATEPGRVTNEIPAIGHYIQILGQFESKVDPASNMAWIVFNPQWEATRVK